MFSPTCEPSYAVAQAWPPPFYQRIEAIRTPAEGGHIGEASGHRNILEEVNFHVAVSEIGVSGKRCRYAPGGGLSSALRQD
jgi:hypothetical protein